MEHTWGWDRLIPWAPDYVLFKVYLDYLTDYFHQNFPANINLYAAACSCLEMEKKLSCLVGFTADLNELSNNIKEKAGSVTKTGPECPVAAAGFMCIAEEGKLMSELLACEIKNREEDDDFITEVLEDQSFNFSNDVRQIVLSIMSTYEGPCSEAVAASLLAMSKEANIVHGLLKLDQNHMDRFAKLNICESQRRHLRKFLIGIRNCKFPELLTSEPVMQSENNYGNSSNVNDMVAISSTPQITSVTAPATAISCDDTLLAKVSRKHMVKFLEIMETTKEFETVNDVPPLDIILYRELMEPAWGWQRLLPWKSGYVLFEAYLKYLDEYYYRNITRDFNLYAAACICLETEKKLSTAVGLTPKLAELSKSIKEKADSVTKSDSESPVAAAGFMCIAEEAMLMSELLECETKNREDEDDFITEVLEDKLFDFSNAVREIVFDILITYKGPFSEAVAASMLGLKKEATLVRELLELNRNCMDRFAKLHICESLRPCLRKFLYGIRNSKFPEFDLNNKLRTSESDQASAVNDREADHENKSMEGQSNGDLDCTTFRHLLPPPHNAVQCPVLTHLNQSSMYTKESQQIAGL
ncbi:uncharacterized protein [Aegilops tauschii subsp. strangulata]|nr:uncharacterized protein LOC109764176 isoform X3 [Aegilops tauschii subsp. strangulata]